jgi:hypothetical protein
MSRRAYPLKEIVGRAVTLVTIVETIDSVSLAFADRLILALFLVFASLRTDAFIGNDITAVSGALTWTSARP